MSGPGNAVLLVAVVGAGAGAVSHPETAVGASVVGAATAVAVLAARILQQVWPSKSDTAIRDLVVAVGKTNTLLNDVSAAIAMMAMEVQEQRRETRRDNERSERVMRDHTKSEEATLQGIDRALGEIAAHMSKSRDVS